MAQISLAQLNLQAAQVLYRREDAVIVCRVPLLSDPSKEYVVKRLTFENTEEAQNLMQEAYSMASIHHYNIITIEGIEFQDSCVFIIMPYFSDGDLSHQVSLRKNTGQFWTEDELVGYFHRLLSTFEYLESIQVVHRDIKPQNLLVQLQQDGSIQFFVADLGCATKFNEFGRTVKKMEDVTVTGTPLYMSPLVRKNYLAFAIGGYALETHNPVKSDVFSLGLTFLLMASLQEPTDLSQLQGMEEKIQRRIDQLQYSQEFKGLLKEMLAYHETNRCTFRGALQRITQLFPSKFQVQTLQQGTVPIVQGSSLNVHRTASQYPQHSNATQSLNIQPQPREQQTSRQPDNPNRQVAVANPSVPSQPTSTQESADPQGHFQQLCFLCKVQPLNHKHRCNHSFCCTQCFHVRRAELQFLAHESQIETCAKCIEDIGI